MQLIYKNVLTEPCRALFLAFDTLQRHSRVRWNDAFELVLKWKWRHSQGEQGPHMASNLPCVPCVPRFRDGTHVRA